MKLNFGSRSTLFVKIVIIILVAAAGFVALQHVRAQAALAPAIRAVVYGTPAPGKIYTTIMNLHDFDPSSFSVVPYTLILNSDGSLIWSRKEPISTGDFKKIGDNSYVLARLVNKTGRWDGVYQFLNGDFNVVKTMQAVGVDHTDIHGIEPLKNGDFMIPSYNLILKNDIRGPVESFLMQEVTPAGKVVFQSDSINYAPISDSYSSLKTETRSYWLKNHINDYFHGNSISEMSDGNILVSSRHLSQIFNIDRKTGKVLWRLGGKTSDFKFVNDPLGGFSFQHDPTMLPNGDLLVYDNGNMHSPKQSRVVEYALDMQHMTATLVWSYEIPGKFTYATGSAQRLQNGNTLIGWGDEFGTSTSDVRISEVDPQGKPVLEVFFPPGAGFYRAYKLE